MFKELLTLQGKLGKTFHLVAILVIYSIFRIPHPPLYIGDICIETDHSSSSSHRIFLSDVLITNRVCVTAIISIATTCDVIEY